MRLRVNAAKYRMKSGYDYCQIRLLRRCGIKLLPASLVHHIGDSSEQMGAGKGFLKVMVTWTESPSGMVDGKAANQNDLCCGPKKMCASGNIKAIE